MWCVAYGVWFECVRACAHINVTCTTAASPDWFSTTSVFVALAPRGRLPKLRECADSFTVGPVFIVIMGMIE